VNNEKIIPGAARGLRLGIIKGLNKASNTKWRPEPTLKNGALLKSLMSRKQTNKQHENF